MASSRGGLLPPAVFLMGPTAAGKTEAALALCRRFPVGLISVDSAQVYRHLNIGAAKPDRQTLKRFPHALINVRDPEDSYSVADFVADAESEIRRMHERDLWPVLAGGSMLYFRALLYGLDKMPTADQALRREIAAEAEQKGWPALHARLARHDPAAAAGMAVHDAQRIQRGLEVLALTGRGPSAHRSHNRLPRLPALRLVLTPSSRHILHERIAGRFDQMLEQGLVDEVRKLRARPLLSSQHASMRSVGYRQVWAWLEGHATLEECRAKVLAATRQLAKRQLTALRRLHGAFWHDSQRPCTADMIFRQVEGFFANR